MGIFVFLMVLVILGGLLLQMRRRAERAIRRLSSRARGLPRGSDVPIGDRQGALGFPPPDQIAPRRPLPGSRLRPQSPSQREKLAALGLPILETTNDVLGFLRLDLRAFLALANPSDCIRPARTNYYEWSVSKKRGGVRIICAPKPRLKAIQQRIKAEILDRVPLHDAAHGFVRRRNIVSNATPHVGQPIVINLDLRDFFGHITYQRVYAVFRRLGYSREVTRCLSWLCTHRPNLCPVIFPDLPNSDLRRPARHAVQGAPTSPALANLVADQIDRRCTGLAKKFNCTYTRYADDLTFSGGEPFKRGLSRFIPLIRRIIPDELFQLHLPKQRFMRSSERQEVTGVIVNSRPNLARDRFDRLKAILHNAAKAGSLESQNRSGIANFRAYLLGQISHVRLLNPQRGARLLQVINAIP